jgi:uncharacterized membrane protein YhfC
MMAELVPWIIAWAVVTTVVLVLAFYRLTLGLHEDPGMHLDAAEAPQAKAKAAMVRRIDKVELYGKSLTIVSAVLIGLTVFLWVYGAVMTRQPLFP